MMRENMWPPGRASLSVIERAVVHIIAISIVNWASIARKSRSSYEHSFWKAIFNLTTWFWNEWFSFKDSEISEMVWLQSNHLCILYARSFIQLSILRNIFYLPVCFDRNVLLNDHAESFPNYWLFIEFPYFFFLFKILVKNGDGAIKVLCACAPKTGIHIKNCFKEFRCWKQNFKEFWDTGKIIFK